VSARLRERYVKEIAPALGRDLNIDNHMAIPRLTKIVLNMGLGEAVANPTPTLTRAQWPRSRSPTAVMFLQTFP